MKNIGHQYFHKIKKLISNHLFYQELYSVDDRNLCEEESIISYGIGFYIRCGLAFFIKPYIMFVFRVNPLPVGSENSTKKFHVSKIL